MATATAMAKIASSRRRELREIKFGRRTVEDETGLSRPGSTQQGEVILSHNGPSSPKRAFGALISSYIASSLTRASIVLLIA